MVELNEINMGLFLEETEDLLSDLKFIVRNGFYGGVLDCKTNKLPPSIMKQCVELTIRYPLKLFSYFDINLCGTEKILAWNGNLEQNDKTKKDIKNLQSHLEFMSCLDGGVIIDCGHFVLKNRGKKYALSTLDKINLEKNQMLLLTNNNDKWSIVSTISELHSFWKEVPKSENIGLAITIYDLSQIEELYQEYQKYFDIKPTILIIKDEKWEEKEEDVEKLLKIVDENNICFIL